MAKRREIVQKYIIENIADHSGDIIPFVAAHFNVTKSAISQHMYSLIEDNVVEAFGKGKNRQFKLKRTVHEIETMVSSNIHEDRVWTEKVLPVLPPLTPGVLDICQYGFTEIFNNVLDHSEAETAKITVEYDVQIIKISIIDFGVGIFNKIRNKFHFADDQQVILELAKGKLTTDPSRHSGEGIFFTSRIFDDFSILSGTSFFNHSVNDNDWLMKDVPENRGTLVSLSIARSSNRTLQSVFDTFAGESLGYSLNRTIIALFLTNFEGGQLVSRSQAKRLLYRAENFVEVILDFNKIDFVGRAFIDEIFRVYKNQHPGIALSYINANKQIKGLIESIQTIELENDSSKMI